jgi:hypothetical protein
MVLAPADQLPEANQAPTERKMNPFTANVGHRKADFPQTGRPQCSGNLSRLCKIAEPAEFPQQPREVVGRSPTRAPPTARTRVASWLSANLRKHSWKRRAPLHPSEQDDFALC